MKIDLIDQKEKMKFMYIKRNQDMNSRIKWKIKIKY